MRRCVNSSNGSVDARSFRTLGQWSPSYTIEKVLSDLRSEMMQPTARRLPQPPEGAEF
jgi:ubiquitin-protein ligase